MGLCSARGPQENPPKTSQVFGISTAAWLVLHVRETVEVTKKTEMEFEPITPLADALPGLVWVALPDGRAEFLNQRWCDYTGLGLQEAIGIGWRGAVHPEDRARLIEYWNGLLASGSAGEVEARLRRHDGRYRRFLFSAAPIADVSGEIVRWCGINTDIEEKLAAQEELYARIRRDEALRESDIRTRAIDSIPGFIGILAPDGSVQAVNRQILEYTGQSLDELRNWGTNGTVHDADLPHTAEVFGRSIASGCAYAMETRLRRHDGEYRWFDNRGVPVHDNEGRVTCWYVLLTDIEDRKRSEAELNATRAELMHVARISTISTLTASIAHEVNQPLAGIVTNANTCLRMLAVDRLDLEGARATAQRTLRDANRASEVVLRLRAMFAHKETTSESLDLNDAVREVIALSWGELQRCRVVLQTDFGAGPASILGDRIQLQQVILNLIVNATDAMREVSDRPRNLFVTTASDGSEVRVSVRDSGIGIDHKATGLFEAFRSTKVHGMGVGLTVSRSIVENHGGRIWATSNDGPGATFSFAIPCCAPSAVKL